MQVDERGRAPGRGAYLCRDGACWARALAEGSLARSLRTGLTEEDRATLEAHARGLGTVVAAATAAEGERR